MKTFETFAPVIWNLCTVVYGRNGSGKTTVQEAIQSALFGLQHRKKERLISKFDPASVPTVELGLAVEGERLSVGLTRSLLNKDGRWEQNGKTVRAKGRALALVQKHLGVPAAAADSLLCNNHKNFTRLLEEFPDDMQSLNSKKIVKEQKGKAKRTRESFPYLTRSCNR